MKQDIELTEEKSNELANVIITLNVSTRFIDVDYAMAAASKLRTLANNNDTTAVLNRSYNPNKSDLLNKQAESLECLCSYIRALRECDKLKQIVSSYDNNIKNFTQLFN